MLSINPKSSLPDPSEDKQITFADLFDLEDIQKLQDEFAHATGVASMIMTPEGIPITRPSNFCRLCGTFIRTTEKGRANCFKSDSAFGKPHAGGPIIAHCTGVGLWDAGTTVMVGGKHVANWLVGQVRDQTQSEDQVRAYAREIGVDEDKMVEAFWEVPAMSLEQFTHVAQALFTLANQLSTIAYQNLQLKRIITEKSRADEALRKSEERFRLFVDSSPDMLFLKDKDLRYVLLNRANADFFGAEEKELIGKRDSDLMPEENARGCEATDRLALETRNIVIGTEEVNGRIYETRKIPLFDREENLGVAGIIRDITYTLEQETKYSNVIETAPDGYWMVDMEGFIIDANQGAADMLEYDKEELIGLHISRIDPLDDGRRVKERIRQAMEGGSVRFETVHQAKSGRRIDVDVIVAHIQFQTRGVVIAFSRDMSERKKAEQEKAILEEQLRQSQKMEAVGRLAGGVAHDFNNILTGITGYTEMIQSSLGVGDPVYQDLEEVRKAAERAAALTSQLLAFSRKQIISPKVIQPNDVIQNSQKMLGRIIGEDITLVFSPSRGLPCIKADPAQLDQILVNLAVNARDAMPDGGRLTIETLSTSIDAEYCRTHPDAHPGHYVLLAVSDTGHGMDPETLAHIFEPFFSTKSKEAGTGLGLSTVYGIMKQNNGFINVQSEPGAGSTFQVCFPAVMEEPETLSQRETNNHPTGAETVLLVEDEPMVRKLAKKILEKQGYRVIEHESGGQAFIFCEKHDEAIDLLLTDVVMPGMNGKELYERLKQTRPGLKALFMSGYTEDVIAHHGILEEGTQFIQKPFTIETLTRKVRGALDRQN